MGTKVCVLAMLTAVSVTLFSAAPAEATEARHGYMKPDLALLQKWAHQRQVGAYAPSAPAHRAGMSPDLRPLVCGPTVNLLDSWPYVRDPAEWNQGQCGNCWMWASTALTEMALLNDESVADRISIQYMNSYDTDDKLCNGGTLTDFCGWYNNSSDLSQPNPNPNMLVPRSNAGAGFVDASFNGAYEIASLAPACAAAVSQEPVYNGVTLNHLYLHTEDATEDQAIANIKAALCGRQAVEFSFFTNFGSGNDDDDGFYTFWDTGSEADIYVNNYESANADAIQGWGGHAVTIVGWDDSDADLSNHYWIVMNSWGMTASRPNGLFHLPMHMNYAAAYTSGGQEWPCYSFETMSLAGTLASPDVGSVHIVGLSSPAMLGQDLSLTAVVSGATPPLTYQWSVDGVLVDGVNAATLTLPAVSSSLDNAGVGVTVTGGATGTSASDSGVLHVQGSQLLADGGFEDGQSTSNWTWSDVAQPAVNPMRNSAAGAHTGDWYARLYGYGIPGGDAGVLTSKAVTLPAGKQARVSYFLQTYSAERDPVVAAYCAIQIVDADHPAVVLTTLKTHTSMDVDHLNWVAESFDISSLNAAAAVNVAFQAKWSDLDGATIFRLDDVQIVTVDAGVATSAPTFDAHSPFTPAFGVPYDLVTITGKNLTGTSAVVLGRTPAMFVVDSDTSVRALLPYDAGSGPVTISAPGGTVSSTTSFLVQPSFVLNRGTFQWDYFYNNLQDIAPSAALEGDTVTLTGMNFLGTTAVGFGDGAINAPDFAVISNTEIQVDVPPGAGNGKISVCAGSLNCGMTSQAFEDLGPETAAIVSLVQPSEATAGAAVNIVGANLSTAVGVTFGGVPASSFTVWSGTTISAVVSSGAVSGPVSVELEDGRSLASLLSFTVLPPFVTSASASTAKVGDHLALVGGGFGDVSEIDINAVAVVDFVASDNNHLSLVVPAGATSGAITVTSPEGQGLLAGFVVDPVAPVGDSFLPDSGAAGTVVVIMGAGFVGASDVSFGDASATFTVVSDGLVSATVPTTATTGPLSVTTPGGVWISTTDFTVLGTIVTNHSPRANAGPDLAVPEGATVTLDASGSYDRDDDVLTYDWAQTDASGIAVTLSQASDAAPIFTAPSVTADTTLTFEVTVSDGAIASTDSVNVVVHHVNHAPVATASQAVTIDGGGSTTLDGSASSDPDGDTLTYYWVQSDGPQAAALGDANTATAAFTAPYLSDGGTFTFTLVVSDGSLLSAPATVAVTVNPGSAPAVDSTGSSSGGCSATAPGASAWLVGLLALGRLVRRLRRENRGHLTGFHSVVPKPSTA